MNTCVQRLPSVFRKLVFEAGAADKESLPEPVPGRIEVVIAGSVLSRGYYQSSLHAIRIASSSLRVPRAVECWQVQLTQYPHVQRTSSRF